MLIRPPMSGGPPLVDLTPEQVHKITVWNQHMHQPYFIEELGKYYAYLLPGAGGELIYRFGEVLYIEGPLGDPEAVAKRMRIDPRVKSELGEE